MDQLLDKLSGLAIDQKETSKETLKPFLNKTGLTFDARSNLIYKLIEQNECIAKCEQLEAADEYLESAKSHISKLENLESTDDDLKSLAGCIQLIDNIVSKNLINGIALVSSSFALELHVIKIIIEKYNLKRILCINWDFDHNSLMQEEFFDDSKVLLYSIHQRDSNSKQTYFDSIGGDKAKGYNVNLPTDKSNFKETEFLLSFYNLFLPIAYEFNPELIIIPTCFNQSATFDSTSIYAHILNSLSCLADGKICLIAKSTTSTSVNHQSLLSSLQTLVGYPIPRLPKLANPNKSVIESILNCLAVLRPYWCCLQLLNQNNEITLETFIKSVYEKFSNSEQSKIEEDLCQNFENTLNKKSDEIISQESMGGVESVCICSDEKMMLHSNLLQPNHPERPDRIKRILETLKLKKLYERCVEVESRHATTDELMTCHTRQHIANIKSLKSKSEQELIELSKNNNSVYYNSHTYESATLATGCVLSVTDSVCSNKFTSGVAVCRPPGHHADSKSCSGFCFFNSIACAARFAQKKYPKSMKKIFILDFDVHHGNGTQSIFEDDDSVLFISLHRYDNGTFYPVEAESNYNCIGSGKGKGFTVNIPWNQSKAGDAEYVAAFLRIVMPIAYEFSPDLVLVSAGFDAAAGDPLGGFKISPAGFGQMIKMLKSLAGGKLVLALEGGYNLTSISESMSSCVSVLLGDPCPSIPPINAKPKAYESIFNVIDYLKDYWTNLSFTTEKLPSCQLVKSFKLSKKFGSNNTLNSSDASIGSVNNTPYMLRNRLNRRNNDSPFSDSNNSLEILSKSTPTSSNKTTNDSARSSPLNLPKQSNKKAEEAHTLIIDEYPVVPFAVVPLSFCPHLLEINNKPEETQINAYKSCDSCNDPRENWICLSCYSCYCSRFVRGHMSEHFEQTNHPMVLSFSDMSVWCYVCDSYVDNEILNDVKQIAMKSKFP